MRRKKMPPFVAISREALKGTAWRSLSSTAKVMYLHLKYKYVGHNNGEIELHYSELKDMFASDTIAKGFKELQRTGWVERTQYGGLFRFVNKYKLTGKYDNSLLN